MITYPAARLPSQTLMPATAIVTFLLACLTIVGCVGQTFESSQAKDTVIDPSLINRNDSHPQLTTERYPRYELRPGDVLEISFEFTPEFNQVAPVQSDGYITLRGIGDIHVAGNTVPEVQTAVRLAYAKVLQDPAIAVVLKEFEKPYVIIGGQVGHPGKYELRGDMTITQAIAVAGGFNSAAKHSQVVLYRRVSSDLYEAKLVNVKQILKNRDLKEDIYLKPGDTLFVPQNTLSKVRQFVPIPGIGLGATF
jgi:polysaccharide biosynthesis/export protein